MGKYFNYLKLLIQQKHLHLELHILYENYKNALATTMVLLFDQPIFIYILLYPINSYSFSISNSVISKSCY